MQLDDITRNQVSILVSMVLVWCAARPLSGAALGKGGEVDITGVGTLKHEGCTRSGWWEGVAGLLGRGERIYRRGFDFMKVKVIIHIRGVALCDGGLGRVSAGG